MGITTLLFDLPRISSWSCCADRGDIGKIPNRFLMCSMGFNFNIKQNSMSVPLKNSIKVATGALLPVVSSHRGGDAALFNGKYLCYEDARTPGDQEILFFLILFFLFDVFFIYISNDLLFSGSPLPAIPISPLLSPCSPIHPFPLPCSGIALYCCTETFQNQGPLLCSFWTSCNMWIISWVFQVSRLISTISECIP